MVRGIQRHERFQNACGRELRKVGDFQNNIKVSRAMVAELARITAGVDPLTPVYVFKELTVNRVKEQSRRADLVFYVPGSSLIYVEYKTIETGVEKTHEAQLRETQNNIVRNLSYRLSFLPSRAKSDSHLRVTTVLVSRHFNTYKRQDDRAVSYPQTDQVRDTARPSDMVSILSSMGRLLRP